MDGVPVGQAGGTTANSRVSGFVQSQLRIEASGRIKLAAMGPDYYLHGADIVIPPGVRQDHTASCAAKSYRLVCGKIPFKVGLASRRKGIFAVASRPESGTGSMAEAST